MKRTIFPCILLVSFILICTLSLNAQNVTWSQFRGPNCSGHASPDANPPIEFGEDNNLEWKVKIREGASSPIIWKDHIYITGCIEETNEIQLICLNRHNGSNIWTKSFTPDKLEGAHSISSPAQSTPALDNEGIYLYSATFGLKCFDHDGNVKWENSTLPKFGHRWGHGTSPVIMDDKLILNLDFKGEKVRGLVALDKYTGEMIWETLTQKVSPLEDASFTGYSTPIRYKDQIILHRAAGIAAYSINDGSPLWWMPIFTSGTSTPIVVDSLIYFAMWNHFSEKENVGEYFDYEDFSKLISDFDRDSDHLLSKNEVPEDMMLVSRAEIPEYEGANIVVRDWYGFLDKDKNEEVDSVEWSDSYNYFNRFMVNVGGSAVSPNNHGILSPEKIKWMNPTKAPEVASPIFVNGCIYTVKDGGWVTCMNADSGDPYYTERLGTTGGYFASPVSVNGHLYICAHRGVVHVIKASIVPEVLSETKLDGKIMATPAIAENYIYIRTSDYLYAFGE